jgi:hypothetical protein
MTAASKLHAYQAAVDFKFDHTVEGTPAWHAADQECDRLCYDFVVASHRERDL